MYVAKTLFLVMEANYVRYCAEVSVAVKPNFNRHYVEVFWTCTLYYYIKPFRSFYSDEIIS